MSFNTHFPNKEKISLSDISNRKEELLLKIREQQQLIISQSQAVVKPVNSIVSSTRSYFRPFQLGFGAIGAFKLGWQTFKRIRKLLRRAF